MQGHKTAVQLTHAGRKASRAAPWISGDATSSEEVVDGARRLLKAGADVIEIRNAYGCLLHSLLSPVSNKRTDEYGGSFREPYIWLTLEVVDAVCAVISTDMPFFVKISATNRLGETMPNPPGHPKARFASRLSSSSTALTPSTTPLAVITRCKRSHTKLAPQRTRSVHSRRPSRPDH